MRSKDVIIDIICEVIGSILIAFATYNFAVYAQFPMTGFSGIALIFYRLFSFPIGLTTIILNVPVAIICYKIIGKQFMLKSIRCMIICSLMIDWLAPLFPYYTGDRMLAALTTGTLGGIGYALIYMRKSSTGGSDFIVMSVKHIRPHLNLGMLTFLVDIGVILAAGIIFDDPDGIIYGMIINFLYAIVIDRVMYGLNSGKVGLVVTKYGQTMCDAIDKRTGRGSTILQGRGGYKKDEKQVVMVACNNKEMYHIEKTVKEIDEEAFMIIMNSTEVHGEGFKVIR